LRDFLADESDQSFRGLAGCSGTCDKADTRTKGGGERRGNTGWKYAAPSPRMHSVLQHGTRCAATAPFVGFNKPPLALSATSKPIRQVYAHA